MRAKTTAENLDGGPGRIRTSNQTVMSGGTRIAGVDFPEDLTRSIVFVASCCDRFWCETGAVIAACLREAFDCLMVMWTGCGKRPEMQLAGGRATPLAPDGWLPGTMVAGARFVQSRQPIETEDWPLAFFFVLPRLNAS